jgi:acetyl-CoA C-acetyltransferase
LDLIERAALAALADAGVSVDRVGGLLATPMSHFTVGDTSELVAERLRLAPGLRATSGYSGAAPQALLAQACRAVSEGMEAVLVVGGIADASVRRARLRGVEVLAPPTSLWSQGSAGVPNDLPARPEWAGYIPEGAAGAYLPASYFALVESVIGAGLTPEAQRARLGELMAPFTAVAARRPELAWFPTARKPDEISEPSASNRLVAEPYTKLMCSFPTVDLAAAIVVTADPGGGRPQVRPLSIVTAKEESPPSGWARMDHPRALERAVEEALRLSGKDIAEMAQFDLYSCFPAAVQLGRNALGLAPHDPRPLTATGGLPYFGGPGASYSLHGIACLVEDLRANPGTLATAVGLGGMVNSFSVGVYGTTDEPFTSLDLGTAGRRVVEVHQSASGPAVVEAMTVLHDARQGPVAAPVIARLPDGSRIGVTAGDPALPGQLSGSSLVGREVRLTTGDDGKTTYLPT